jgi:hypothetical protein
VSGLVILRKGRKEWRAEGGWKQAIYVGNEHNQLGRSSRRFVEPPKIAATILISSDAVQCV